MSLLTSKRSDTSHQSPAPTHPTRTGPGTGRGGQLARWASAVNVVAGVWLLASPWILDYGSRPTAAIWNSAVVGLVVAAVAYVKVVRPQAVGMSWLNVALGGWLVLSPWVLSEQNGAVAHNAGNVNMVLVGMVVIAFAVASSAGTFLGHDLDKRRR